MAGRRRSILALCLLTSSIIPLNSASSSETITYKYDPRGRLVQVSRSGTVNNGVSACYAYDKADNRSNVKVERLSPVHLHIATVTGAAARPGTGQRAGLRGGVRRMRHLGTAGLAAWSSGSAHTRKAAPM